MKKQKGTGLRFVVSQDFKQVPRYLVKAACPKDVDIDRFITSSQEMLNAPSVLLGLFLDKLSQVRGFVLGFSNQYDNYFYITMMAVDDMYRKDHFTKEVTNILEKITDALSLGGIRTYVDDPTHLQVMGYQQVPQVLMEYTNGTT